MTDEAAVLRRRDDVLLSEIDKRLALLEQSHQLDSKAREARDKALDMQFAAFSNRLDTAISLWQQVTAEPQASPAGRALLADMEPLHSMVQQHEVFVQQMQGAFKLARLALGTSIIALIAAILSVITDLRTLVP